MTEQQLLVDSYFNEQASYWKSVYERNDVSAAILQKRRDRCVDWVRELRLDPSTEVLEVGCGAGFTAIPVAQLGYHVHAVDHASAMLKLTGIAAERAGVGKLVSAECADASSLAELSENAFGLVISLGVLAWLDSPQMAMQAMRRVLKPGGYLILSIGNRWSLRDCVDPPYNPLLSPVRRKVVARLRRAGWLATPVQSTGAPVPRDRHCSPPEVDRMLSAAGFERIKTASVGFGPLTFFRVKLFPDSTSMKLHRALQKLADKGVPFVRFAGGHYMVLAKKRA